MIKKKTVELAVGLFVIAGFTCLILLALQVSGLNVFARDSESFVIHAKFSNIGGLKIRSKVTLSGVQIGRVENITLPVGKEINYDALVTIKVRGNIGETLPEDSVASIRTAGLIGDNFIAITPGGSEEYLSSGDNIQETYSAIVLEDIISKFVVDKGNS